MNTMACRITLASLLVLAANCVGGLDFDGKACSSDHPCPGGYTCDRGVCRAIGTDAGTDGADAGPDGSDADPDGADDGPGRCENDLPCTLDDTSCDLSIGECVPLSLCEDGSCHHDQICVGGACVSAPDHAAQVESGDLDLSCYSIAPLPPPDLPSSMPIGGFVFSDLESDGSSQLVNGLSVRLHLLSDVLSGVLTNFSAETKTCANDLQDGSFSLDDVPTNTDLVLEIYGLEQYAHTFLFGLYVRADTQLMGLYEVPVLSQTTVEGVLNSTDGDVEWRDGTGLVVGFVQDCLGSPLIGAKGGLSQAHDLLIYPYTHQLPSDHTGKPGAFCAVNVTPIRGVVSAMAATESNPVCSLGAYSLRVFPGCVSELVFDRPD